LFDRGVEQKRFPPVNKSGVIANVLKYDYNSIVDYFELEKRYLATRKVRDIK
jgi:hypothetical protein